MSPTIRQILLQPRIRGEILFRYLDGDSLATLGATYTRSATAPYRDSNGILQTAASGVARDSHYELDPVSGLYKPHLLLEGQRTNLCLRSSEFDVSPWTFIGGAGQVVTPNAVVAPDGTTTADTLQAAAFQYGGLRRQLINTTAQEYTFSIFVKKGNHRYIGVRCGNNCTDAGSGGTKFPFIDLDTGIVSNVGNSAIKIISEVWNNGWFRVSVSFLNGATGNFFDFGIVASDGTFSGTPSGTATVHIWEAQVEAGSFPSSRIPTAGSTATRAEDALSFPISFAPQEMTVYSRHIDKGSALTSASAVLYIGNGGGSSPRLIFAYHLGTVGQTVSYYNGALTASIPEVLGESIESRATLLSTGSVVFSNSRNGASENIAAAPSAPQGFLDAAWASPPKITVGKFTSNMGYLALRDIIIAKGIKSLSYFRALVQP